MTNGWRTADGHVTDADGRETQTASRPLPLEGGLYLRPIDHPRSPQDLHEAPDLRRLLSRPQSADTVIEATENTQLSILDADTHHWPEKPSAEICMAYINSLEPTPDIAWVSHGHGIKAIYLGRFHRQRALAAALSLPSSFTIELLNHTRHPKAASSKHQAKFCQGLQFFENDVNADFTFALAHELTPVQRAEALEKLDLQEGDRFDHGYCPLDPTADSEADDSVVLLERGVYCHRCAAKGIQHAPHLNPGFYPYTAKVSPATSRFHQLATHRVHWTHARLELMHFYPHLAERLLEEIYREVLKAKYGADDPRIGNVFNRHLDFVRGAEIWLDAKQFEDTVLDNDAADSLPYAQDVKRLSGQCPEIRINKSRRSQLKNRSPEGYTPVRPYTGITFAEESNASIPVCRPRQSSFAIELLDDPLAGEEALASLRESFPGVNHVYLRGCIAAAICAEARSGQPPMLVCTGPSGSGKEQHIRLAASFLEEDTVKLPIAEEEESFMRNIGMAAISGKRFLLFDEFGKGNRTLDKFHKVLQISSQICWRRLYGNKHSHTPIKSAFFFPCVRFPDFLTKSTEFWRRVRCIHLHRKLPDWAVRSGGDTCGWRGRCADNARLANSILTHVWQLCHKHKFHFFSVADELGLHTFTDGDAAGSEESLRELYRYARGECGERTFIEHSSTFRRGWLDLNVESAHRLVEPLVSLEEDSKAARRQAQANLEAQPWNDLLGISEPPITCKVKIHGTRWAFRFESTSPCLRGQEVINEQLPPIAKAAGGAESASTGEPPCEPASHILRDAGFPE